MSLSVTNILTDAGSCCRYDWDSALHNCCLLPEEASQGSRNAAMSATEYSYHKSNYEKGEHHGRYGNEPSASDRRHCPQL